MSKGHHVKSSPIVANRFYFQYRESVINYRIIFPFFDPSHFRIYAVNDRKSDICCLFIWQQIYFCFV